MNIDNTEIKIFNINNNFNLFNINAKQYDTTGARGIVFRLVKDNLAMDLTNIVVNIGGKKADEMDIFNSCDILDSKSGLIQVNLTTQMLTTAGILKLELILMKDSMRLSSYPFEINVAPSITNFQAVQSSDEFGALTQALSKVNDTLQNIQNKVNGAISELKGKNIGGVNLFDNTDFSEKLKLYESTASVQFFQDTSIQGQSSIFYEGKKIIGLQSFNNQFGDTYCTLMQTNDRVIQSNTTYTLSFYYMSLHTGEDLSSSSFLYLNRSTDGAELIELNDLDLNSYGGRWKRYTKTFTTGDSIKNIQLRLGFRCTNFSWLIVDGLKLEKGIMATDWSLSNADIEKLKEKQEKALELTNSNVDSLIKQIKNNNDTLYDLQHNWFSDCSNSLCINGFKSLKLYPQGVYYITGTSISELSQIDHSVLKNGQSVYFIAETCDQTACIKFCKDDLAKCGVYTPKGQDFWITGRDNGDTIYIMQKIGGAMRFRSL